MNVGIIILAAGESKRMGRPKQLLEFENQPLIVRVVDAALASSGWPVVVVLGAHADTIRPRLTTRPVLIAENPAWGEGMASSLRAGVSLLQQFSRSIDAALIALCDQPAFTAATVDRFVETQRATQRSIVASRYSGRNGAPALFLREHFAALSTLTGEEGARALLNRDAEHVASIELPEFAIDLDTPEDVAEARRRQVKAETS